MQLFPALVNAAPHQHLVHVRAGKVIRSQQGGSAWRWPQDSVALIDTSVRRLQFVADQVTREKTGVQVTGFAVFRVIEPLVAWRMLDLSDPSGIEDILRPMLVGATRRLVANLSLEDCLTRRKDALAAELMAEVAPVVQGRGAPGDTTDRGWGLGLDTVEVQDVRVLSEEVFNRLQAPFRAVLALDAVRAQAEVTEAEAAVRQAEERRAEEHRRGMLALAEAREEEDRRRRREHEEYEVAREAARLAATLNRQAEEQAAKLARQAEEQAATLSRQATEQAAKLARLEEEQVSALARREREEASALARRQEAEAVERGMVLARAEADVTTAEHAARALRTRAAAEVEKLRAERAALGEVSDGRLRELLYTETVPAVAAGLRGLIGEVHVRPGDLDGIVEIARRVMRGDT